MKKYRELELRDSIFLYDLDNGTDPVAGINQDPLTTNGVRTANKQTYEIEEGLDPDNIYNESCITGLLKLKDKVDAIFVSPPYCANKDYDDDESEDYEYKDNMPYHEYLALMKRFMNSAYVAIKQGGVFGLNISNIMVEGEKRPTGIDLLNIAIESGWTFQEQIMWVKPLGAGKQRTGSYVLSYQKYQDGLKTLETFKFVDPKPHLKKFVARKKEILAKRRELDKAGKKETQEYLDVEKDRYETNIALRVLELLNENDIDKVKEILKQDAAQVYRPNPITEYIWVLTKGDDITNKTTIDLKQVKDQMYNVWYNKTHLGLKKDLTNDLIGSDIDKIMIKDSIPDVALKWLNETLNTYSGAISEMASKAMENLRPKLKKESDLTYTKANKAFKEVYEKNLEELRPKIHKQVVTKLSKALENNRENISGALAESFAVFYRGYSDNWDMAPTNTKVRNHPAPFPVDLPMRFIELYLPDGGLIVDAFMGSGSTAQAAIRLNKKYKRDYHYIGFDISKKYVELANKFLKKELAS